LRPEIQTMNDDSPSPAEGPVDGHGQEGRASLGGLPVGSSRVTTYTYSHSDSFEERPPEPVWLVEHDRQQGTFRLSGPGGKVEVFRDKALRYLVLEPDPESGQMVPVIRDGRPWILSLCREAPERR
jgi:hypothetical protein